MRAARGGASAHGVGRGSVPLLALLWVAAVAGQGLAADCAEWTSGLFEPAGAAEVRECLEAGLRADARDENGVTPLHLAAGSGDKYDIAALLRAGAEVDARTEDGWTPLHFAAENPLGPIRAMLLMPVPRTEDNIVALLEAGADANARSQGGLIPLHRAVRNSSEAILILLDAGAEVDARTEDGWTPLHFACGSSPAAALVLLAAGADVNAQDEDGQTPLYRAVAPLTRPVSPTLIGALLAVGAWVNIPGHSPLHHAARFANNPAVIEALLSAGADASARDPNGKTPWDYAQENEALRGTDAYWLLNDARFR